MVPVTSKLSEVDDFVLAAGCLAGNSPGNPKNQGNLAILHMGIPQPITSTCKNAHRSSCKAPIIVAWF
jgi:hypothetical protein